MISWGHPSISIFDTGKYVTYILLIKYTNTLVRLFPCQLNKNKWIKALQALSRNTAIEFESFIYTFRESVCVYCWSSLIAYKFISKYYMVGWNLSRKGFIISTVTNMWYTIKMGVVLYLSVLLDDSVCWNSLIYSKRTNKHISWCWNMCWSLKRNITMNQLAMILIRLHNSW